ncbi:hypothetical protein BV898_04220 [Hypsibius exemplaris]|uniref:Protein phosphatase 1 regulatory subunit 14C n=1 Tax=Hypsibius exemplaris TaxID=2072580 RepID=A0A1W0X3N1_HYPEX|nr:hypothetical protein BV898_04220 [Hypsibius exemplaris]
MDRISTKKLVEQTAALSLASSKGSAGSDAGSRVGFSLNGGEKVVKIENDRKKYLTAKYGQHQMALIKKRLNVELWLIEELQLLYPAPSPPPPKETSSNTLPAAVGAGGGQTSSNNNHHQHSHYSSSTGSSCLAECDIDLDDLLDLERDEERRRFLRGKLADCPQPALIVARFIEDVLLKAKSL